MQISKNFIPSLIYGIDFSGAQDAGRKIWIAEGINEKDKLLIRKCLRAKDLPGSGINLTRCLPALRDFIKQNQDAAFGLDFPFGLPKDLFPQDSWKEFILKFPSLYSSPEDLKEKCKSRTLQITSGRRRELKRKTDEKSKTPYSPYNLRIFKQTYYGITKILYPLVHESLASVLPMENA